MTEQITLQKALFKIKKLKQMLDEKQKKVFEPIAIVGIGCRYPQASSKNDYWRLLSDGKNVINKMSEDRWQLLKGTEEIALRDLDYPYWGGYLSDIAAFDAYFFGISPREALRMDPQHRLLLEVAYEAIEDAGIPVETLAGSKTGVFSSLYVSQLAHMQTMDNDLDALFLPTGNAISIAANRISYLFDLHGPSVVIDSACSSSMAGLYLACLNLHNESCDLALVCGAKLNILPYINFVLGKAKMLSPDGQCKTFDAGANGYVQGEGVGVIVLKPLSKALKDGDRIYSVITGCAVNQDGKTNGLTAPNGLQQESMLKSAYSIANVNPLEISYVECHGTGTFLGDPIEVEALGTVISKNRQADQPCWIGSVKTNIGHLEPGAGVASVIKVALGLQHATIPPHLNFITPNPHIPFDKYHFNIPLQAEAWPIYGKHRVAGISGFGFGGTNAHIVMRDCTEEETIKKMNDQPKLEEIFVLSAKDPQALQLLAERWSDYLEHNSEISLSHICYNTHLRRSHYFYRLAIVAKSTQELKTLLSTVFKNNSSQQVFINDEKTKKINKTLAKNELQTLSATDIAKFYVNYAQIAWSQYEENRYYPMLEMPLYPWQHKHYWPSLGHKQLLSDDSVNGNYPLRGRKVKSPLNTLQFEFRIENKLIPDVQDTYNILHAGYYLEMLAFIAQQLTGQPLFTVEGHRFLSPLIAPENALVTLHIVLEKNEDNSYRYHYYSNIDGQQNWVEHATGTLFLNAAQETKLDPIGIIKARCTNHETADQLYERVIAMGMPAGESIRWTQQYWFNSQEILCEFKQPKFQEKNDLFTLKVHPGIIDGCIQPIFKLLPPELIKPYIAEGSGKIKFYGMQEGPYFLFGNLAELENNGEKIRGNCYLINSKNQLIAEFENICLTQLDDKFQIQQIMQANAHAKLDLAAMSEEERKQKVTQFLTEQIGTIFSIPKEDIELNRSLRDMGIDSLSALVLMRTLELGLSTSYSMHDLLEGPTINELVEFVLKTITPNSTIGNTTIRKANWISFRQPQKDPAVRLFCFPYGGGGASIYRDWQRFLPNEIEVCPIQLPGREDRLDENAMSDMGVLVDHLITHLKDEMDRPFAFFGHSFGSLIGFELTRELRRRDLSQPIHLFASAFPDPRVPTKSLDNLLKQLSDIHLDLFAMDTAAIAKLNDDQLLQLSNIFNENGIVEYGEHIMNKDIIKFLLPIFIGDMRLVKGYQFKEEASFKFPITVFVGKNDTWVSYEDHLNWIQHTSNQCAFHIYDSGHLFIKDEKIRKDMFDKIAHSLRVVEETV